MFAFYSFYLRVTGAYAVYHVTRLVRECTMSLCVTSERFSFACKSTKTHAPGYAHVKHVFLLAGTVRTSIKFKSSCTIVRFGVTKLLVT